MENSTNRFLTVIIFLMTIIATVAITILFVKEPATSGAQTKTAIGAGVSAEEVERTVAQFLTDNPHVIVQAFQSAKQKEANKEREDAQQAIKLREDEILHDPDSPFTGNPNADVTIVKFSDYNCGFCKRVVPDIITILAEDKNVKFVSKDFPILGPRSTANAKAAMAVFTLAPEKWFEFHKGLLKAAPRTDAQLLAIAAKNGIDTDELKVEMSKAKYAKQIQKNIALGQAIGVRGTPAFVINGEFVRGAVGLDIFRERIAAARARK